MNEDRFRTWNGKQSARKYASGALFVRKQSCKINGSNLKSPPCTIYREQQVHFYSIILRSFETIFFFFNLILSFVPIVFDSVKQYFLIGENHKLFTGFKETVCMYRTHAKKKKFSVKINSWLFEFQNSTRLHKHKSKYCIMTEVTVFSGSTRILRKQLKQTRIRAM